MPDPENTDITKSLAAYQLALAEVFARVDHTPGAGLTTWQLLHGLDTAIRTGFEAISDLGEQDRLQVLRFRQDLRRMIDLRREHHGIPPLPPDA